MAPKTSPKDSGLRVKVLEAINFFDYYTQFTGPLQPAGGNNQYLGRCPFHDDARGSFSVNTQEGLWNCKGCDAKGDIFNFHQKYFKLSGFKETLIHIARRYGLTAEADKFEKKTSGPVMLKADLAEEYHQALLLNNKALDFLQQKRGINFDTVQYFNLGYKTDEKRLTIPIYDAENKLLNIRRYSSTASQKMLNWTGYGSAELYGWPELENMPADTPIEEPIILCEGEFDRMILWQAGFKYAMTNTNGAKAFKPAWGKHFKGRHVVIMFDADEPGQRGADRVAACLCQYVASLRNIDLKAAGCVQGTPEDKDISDYARKPDLPAPWPVRVQALLSEAPLLELSSITPLAEEAEAARTEEEEHSSFVSVFEKNGCYMKPGKYAETALSNFLLEPIRRVKVEDEEVLEARVVFNNGYQPKAEVKVSLSPSNWITKGAFKKALGDLGAGYVGSEDDLQEIKVFLAYKDCPQLRGETKLGLHKRGDEWVMVASDKTITPRGEEIQDLIHFNPTTIRQKYEINNIQPASQAQIAEVSSALAGFNDPGICACIAGWMFAAMIKPRFAQAVPQIGNQFPVLLIWGQQGAGKTRTTTKVILPFFADFNEPKKVDEMTRFTYMINASATNIIPLALDEYKPSKMSRYQQQETSSFLRAVYNSSYGERGVMKENGLNVKSYNYTSPVILIGEQAPDEAALHERVIDLMLTLGSREGAIPIDTFSGLNMSGVGYKYLAWSLGLTDQQIGNIYRAELAQVSPSFLDRIRENLATIKTGLRLWKLFMMAQGLAYNADETCARAEYYLKENMLDDTEKDGLRSKTAVDAMIEGFSAMAAIDEKNLLVKDMDWKLSQYNDLLYLRLQTILPKFSEWAWRTKYSGEILDGNSFRRRLLKEPYFSKQVPIHFATNHNSIAEGNIKNVKVCALSVQKMLSIGLDLSGFGIEEYEKAPF